MRKVTLLLLVVMAFVVIRSLQAKDITIYVQADQEPYIHYWGGITSSIWPKGEKLTETTTVNTLEGTPMTFYYKTFQDLEEDAKINFLFNYKGDEDKTHDINGISSSRYYIYRGNHEYEDITSLITGEADDVIEKVQLPGDFSQWNGDANTFEATEEKYTYVRVVDFSDVTTDIVNFKLLVNNGHWLGWKDIVVNAPDGWVQEAEEDGNIQLNLAAIGAKKFTITAIWGGGNMSSAAWRLNIDAEADAIIDKAKLAGTFNDWNGDEAVMKLTGSKTYSFDLDLSEVNEQSVEFKLLINNHHWLGFYDLVDVAAPEGWAEESAEGGNIQLNLAAANTKKFTITATWAGGKIGSAGWSLKITAAGATQIGKLKDFNKADMPVYDLSGRRMANNASHGMYIKGGKKIIMR